MTTAAQQTAPPKRLALKALARKLISLLRQKDTPHRIALGLCLGIFVGTLPIMGIQMTVVTLLALPLRANLKTAVAGVWISNPITFIPMYFGYYKLGLLFFPSRAVSLETFISTIKQAGEIDWSAPHQSLSHILAVSEDILVPMWTGSILLAVIFGAVTYFVTRAIVTAYRASKDGGTISRTENHL